MGKIFTTAIASVAFWSISAFGACHLKQECNKYGLNCTPRQICGSILEMPPVETVPGPLASSREKSLDLLGISPPGMANCQTEWVCGQSNDCSWQRRCR